MPEGISTTHPHAAHHPSLQHHFENMEQQREAGTLGMWVFLVTEIMFFGGMFLAYTLYRTKYPQAFASASNHLSWQLGAINTGVLILSSIALQWAYLAARRDDMDGVIIGLLAGGASAVMFLVGQLLAWHQLREAGYFVASNPANSFFYLITAAHGLHLAGGLVALGRTIAKVWHGVEMVRLRLSVELCAIYWHFLLLVWLVLLGLLTGWTDNFVDICRQLLT